MSSSRAAHRWIVVGPYLVVVLLLVLVAAVGVDVLSAARAFVGGESLYSKGQKDAVHHLQRYLQTHDPSDWERHRSAIALPVGDRRARLALDRPDADESAAAAGFLAGGNHPDDVAGLIRVFRYGRWLPPIDRAIDTWRRGDEMVAELERVGLGLRQHIVAGTLDAAHEREAQALLAVLNARLTELEADFSAQLGEASRLTQRVVLGVFAGVAAALALAGIWLTAGLLRRQFAAEDALRASNQRWERAARAAEIGLFELDLRNGRLQLDPRAGALFGLSLDGPAVVRVDDLRRVVHPDDAERLAGGITRIRQDGRALELRFRVVAGTGWRDVEINTRVAEQDPNLLNGLLWDVSADVRAEQLRLDKEAAERSSRAKTEFLSRVSHELRTPLNAVLGFAQLMAADDREPLTPTQRARVDHVLSSGRHLLGLINDVLDLSHIDQGAFSLACREVDLAVLLHGSVQRAEPLGRQLSIAISLEAPDGDTMVCTDPLRVEQIVGNLLSNAIKYNRPHGRVMVRLRLDETHWALEVEDTGRGIAPSALRQLYQPFNRLGAEQSRVEGTGLGLVITRQLVGRLGGELEARSEPGVGSTFSVRLPRRGPAVPPAMAAPPAQPVPMPAGPSAGAGDVRPAVDASGPRPRSAVRAAAADVR